MPLFGNDLCMSETTVNRLMHVAQSSSLSYTADRLSTDMRTGVYVYRDICVHMHRHVLAQPCSLSQRQANEPGLTGAIGAPCEGDGDGRDGDGVTSRRHCASHAFKLSCAFTVD